MQQFDGPIQLETSSQASCDWHLKIDPMKVAKSALSVISQQVQVVRENCVAFQGDFPTNS